MKKLTIALFAVTALAGCIAVPVYSPHGYGGPSYYGAPVVVGPGYVAGPRYHGGGPRHRQYR